MMQVFSDKIYQQLRQVPKGRVTTYKALAESLGSKAYRAVGAAMRTNPYAPEVPCHRVVAADGTIGGFKGKKMGETIAEKTQMLEKEGVIVENGKVKDFENVLFTGFK